MTRDEGSHRPAKMPLDDSGLALPPKGLSLRCKDMEAAALEACGSESQLGRSILRLESSSGSRSLLGLQGAEAVWRPQRADWHPRFSPAYEGNKTLLFDGIRAVTAAADQQRQIFEDEEEQHHTISRDRTAHESLGSGVPKGVQGEKSVCC